MNYCTVEEIKESYEIVGVWDNILQVLDNETDLFRYFARGVEFWFELPMTSIKSEFFVKGE